MKTDTNLVKLCMQIRDCICQGFLLPALPFFQRKVLLYFWKKVFFRDEQTRHFADRKVSFWKTQACQYCTLKMSQCGFSLLFKRESVFPEYKIPKRVFKNVALLSGLLYAGIKTAFEFFSQTECVLI